MVFDKPIIQNELFEGIMGHQEFLEYSSNLTAHSRKNLVVISITEPYIAGYDDTTVPIIALVGYHDAIQMKFWDVEEAIGGKYPPISHEQGLELREFILRNSNKKFLIHCRAGISRSAGVGLAVECLLLNGGDKCSYSISNSEIKNYGRYFPNLTVFDRIIGESNNNSKS